MAQTIFLKRRLGTLSPADRIAENAIADLPDDKWIKAVLTVPRNVEHHRKFFALLQAVFPHQRVYPTLDGLTAAIKCATGHGDTVKLPDGRIVLVPKSISFAKMDQKGFQEFYERAVDLILTRILPNVGREDLDRQVGDILDGRNAA